MGTTVKTFAETKDGESFVFYPTFLNSIEAIKNTEMRLAMFEAVANYGVYGVLPDFTETDPNGLLDGIFSQIRFSIDAAKAKRDYTIEVQRFKQLLRWKKITRSEYDNLIEAAQGQAERAENFGCREENQVVGTSKSEQV